MYTLYSTIFSVPYMTGCISPLLIFPEANFLRRSSLYDKISGWSDLGVRTITTRPKIFIGISCCFFFFGGGGGGYTCNIYISYVRNLCFAGSLLIMIRQNSGPN